MSAFQAQKMDDTFRVFCHLLSNTLEHTVMSTSMYTCVSHTHTTSSSYVQSWGHPTSHISVMKVSSALWARYVYTQVHNIWQRVSDCFYKCTCTHTPPTVSAAAQLVLANNQTPHGQWSKFANYADLALSFVAPLRKQVPTFQSGHWKVSGEFIADVWDEVIY